MSEKEYIERKALMHDIMRTVIVSEKKKGYTNPELKGINKVIDRIKAQPTADVEEVRHGKWETIINPDGYIEGWLHEECGRQVTSKDEYCPHCGAKMDKE